MISSPSRRDFLRLSSLGFGTAVLSGGLSSCWDKLSDQIEFRHGVASGDPLTDRVILWTRVTPEGSDPGAVRLAWEIARDPEFLQMVNQGSLETSSLRDYTVKVDVTGLAPGRSYYFRFRSADRLSPVGRTRTLAERAEEVKLAVVSCSNYPTGYFHVYREIAQRSDLDAVLHLGDYIYEYPRGGYASEEAAALGREVLPFGETLSLADYRQRYAQYRGDPDLQAAHASHPFLVVWDDHEIANDTWREGAENHGPNEGDFVARKLAALQAYAEWMPIRPAREGELTRVYRSFSFGGLVDLHMLDTRLVGRDRQLELTSYVGAEGLALPRFFADLKAPERTLLGEDQKQWLLDQLSEGQGVWQVLGQQVLMGRMYLPGALATGQLDFEGFLRLSGLAAQAALGATLSPADQAFLEQKKGLLALPSLPFNLDAWDGYEAEREEILSHAQKLGKELIVLAGDTHNAWSSELRNQAGLACGIEFATASVTSPGLEENYKDRPQQLAALEAQLPRLIPHLLYANVSQRGYLLMSFTREYAQAEFLFVDTITEPNYQVVSPRTKQIRKTLGSEI